MHDRATALLFEQLAQQGEGAILLPADENGLDAPWTRLPPATLVISNRCDVAEQGRVSGLNVLFNDFDFSALPAGPFDIIGFRVSKEKLVSHHIINASFSLLKPSGTLLVCGEKTDGLKTYARRAAALLGDHAVVKKHGTNYLAAMKKNLSRPGETPDDGDYATLRPIAEWQGLELWSKPGVFGWNKIDRASAFLAEHLDRFLAGADTNNLLDLGCGYSYLATVASRYGFKRIVATDNNAAALDSARRTFAVNRIRAEVIAADCGAGIDERFDIILCNPPFHQGFVDDRRLTEKFLAAAVRLLKPRGRALFVVHGFVPLETLARPSFGRVGLLAADRSFKLVVLEK